jgi:hypothetical protein
MKHQQILDMLDDIIIYNSCPKCGAKRNERCVENGKKWDQGVHKERVPKS